MLGPGTMLSAALCGFAAWWLLGLPATSAAILGAALASTDPVLLRGLLQRRDLPSNARLALRLESGLNDAVLLPVVIVAMTLAQGQTLNGGGWARLTLGLFILGPGAGVAVGLVAVAALDLIRKRIGVRRDYESLYSLGVAFSAFAIAEVLHGSGFLAAFAAGLTIAALDVELCDCFIEYGGVTAEMLLLFTFVLFGSSLIWTGLTVVSVASVAFAIFVMFIRIPVYLLSLWGSRVDRRGCLLIAWFGPRGLSSLLLVLLPVFAGIPGSEQLFPLCSLVVLMSVVLHGGFPMLLTQLARRRAQHDLTSPEESADPVTDQSLRSLPVVQPAEVPTENNVPVDESDLEERRTITERVSIDEVVHLQNAGNLVIFLDVRTDRSIETSDEQIKGAVRVPPEHVAAQARELNLPQEAWLIAYCA
jgi:NhaP-type Na+/H+ or K+/H+ antiporter